MKPVWKRGILRDICSLRQQTATPARWATQQISLFSVPAFDAGCGPEVVPANTIRSTKTVVMPGDVLFCKMNPRKNRVWFVTGFSTEHAICSSEFLPLVANDNMMPEFLELILMSPQFQRAAQKKSQASTKSRERVRPRDALKLPVVYVESKDDQREIVNSVRRQLTYHDRLRLAAERQLEAMTALPTATLRELFSHA